MSCPCGLTKEDVQDLDQRDRVPLIGGKCQNPRADGAEGVCGRALGAHQSSQGVAAGGDGAGFYSKGNSIYDFWCAVVKPDAVAIDKTGKKLHFTDGTRWGWTKDVKELYVRDCYAEAISELEGKNMAMMEGTPGIGKTLFIFYFIYEQVRRTRANNGCIPTFVIVGRSLSSAIAPKKYLLRVDSEGHGVVQSPTTEVIPDYLITDTIGDAEPSYRIQYIHVSSVNNENVKDVRKLVDQLENTTTIYLAGFTYDEYCESDGESTSDEADRNFYYDVFGGSLRNLRSAYKESKRYPKDIFDIVHAEMKSFFGGFELAGVPQATWNRTAKALARKLQNPNEGIKMSGEVDPSTISRSVIIHWTPSPDDPDGWQDFPASKFMRHLAGHICDVTKKDALSRLRDAIGPSGIGYVHEHDAHQYRLAHLSKAPGITLWSLQGKVAVTLCLPIKRVVRIRTVDDIERLEEGDYGLPTVSNFPFLDAVMKPNQLFQDTVAQDGHPSVAKVPEILKALKVKARATGTVMLINTLATNNFDAFKGNRSDVMKPFSQWKTSMEAHSDDVTVVTAMASGESKRGKRKELSSAAEVKPARKSSKN